MHTPYVTAETLAENTSLWLARIAPYNRDQLKLKPQRCALLVVDMQKFFMEPTFPTYTCGSAAIVPNIQRLLASFRQAHLPVIFTRHVHQADGSDLGIMGWWWQGACIEGSPESEIHPDIAPLATEKVICKHRYSAFFDTDLGTILRCLEIEDIIITGIMTNMCCESTARDAYYRDYRVFFPADATGTINEEMHLSSLINLAFGFASITTTQTLIEQIL